MPLLFGHRADDRLNVLEVFLRPLHICALEHLFSPREERHEVRNGAHFLEHTHLLLEVLKRKLIFPEFLLKDIRLLLIVNLFGLLNQ